MNKQNKILTVKGFISGKVQGVGFRYFVELNAKKKGVTGYAKNLSDGRVEIVLSGEAEALWEVKKKVVVGPLISDVTRCEWEEVDEQQEFEGFCIF